jgi:tetratricopeptide (TPR) repeat protein
MNDLCIEITEEDIEISAMNAELRGDQVGIEGAWLLMRENFPSNPQGYVKAGVYQRGRGNYRIADAMFEFGLRVCSDHRALMIHYAWSAFYSMDWELSKNRWHALIKLLPNDPAGYNGAALSLMRMGQLDSAEYILRSAPLEVIDDVDLSVTRAQLANARQNWTVALPLWERLKQKYPMHEKVLQGYGNALQHLETLSNDEYLSNNVSDLPQMHVPQREDVSVVGDEISKTLMLNFESIGGNCEFGLVQRHFGAEPISLLRWTEVPATALTRMLHTRFEALGDADQSEILLVQWKEYFIIDKKFGLSFHTWVNEHEAHPDEIFKRQAKRIRRLRDALIELLKETGKIFVYKPTKYISIELIYEIFKEFRGCGPNTLLLVQQSDQFNPAGTVREEADGLLLGYVSRLSPTLINSQAVWDIPYEEWRNLCKSALNIYSGTSSIVA